jgi:hypothetical protein
LYFILFMSPNMFCSAIYFQEISIYLPSVILAAIMRCMVEVPACFFTIPYFLTNYPHFLRRELVKIIGKISKV